MRLFPPANGYSLYLMRLPFHNFRAAMATGLSLWMAVLACLVGCTLPSLANSSSISFTPPAIHRSSAEQTRPDVMANMENCPRHSANNAPVKPHDHKPAPGGGMSCCPVEVTVASKQDTATLHVAPVRAFVSESDLSLVTIRSFHPVEFLPPASRNGRDTLLATHLLRV